MAVSSQLPTYEGVSRLSKHFDLQTSSILRGRNEEHIKRCDLVHKQLLEKSGMEPYGKSFCENKISEMGSYLKISLDETNVENKCEYT